MASIVMNVRVATETKDALDRLARDMDRPRAHLAARAIEEFVQRNAWQIAAIKEGMGQLDAGESHDLADVFAETDAIIDQAEAERAG